MPSSSLTPPLPSTALSSSPTLTVSTTASSDVDYEYDDDMKAGRSNFLWFRLNYLLVTLVVYLADGLQGTHLYVLYSGYGYSVASLYCLGFWAGAISAPVTGTWIDRFGRKKSAIVYCALEVAINYLEQLPYLGGLIVCRVVGGITTNLLSSVFETWLDTEYRRRGFDAGEYEIVMRDSVVVSNVAAILSGYLAHVLAERFGPVGPFQGAVACTAIALLVVLGVWTENYGNSDTSAPDEKLATLNENAPEEKVDDKSMADYLSGAVQTFRSDSRMLRVGIIQGLTMASLHIFVFLWSPTLADLATRTPATALGLDKNREPAYGLVFGTFMLAGVVGGLCSPTCRRAVAGWVTPDAQETDTPAVVHVRPVAVELLAACCYFGAGLLLLVPLVLNPSFQTCVLAFVAYEILIGVYMPLEGVIRSLYLPSDARASMMILPRIIVNVAVAICVASTNFISNQTAFGAIALLMFISGALQISLVSKDEWDCLFRSKTTGHRLELTKEKVQ